MTRPEDIPVNSIDAVLSHLMDEEQNYEEAVCNGDIELDDEGDDDE